MIAQSEGSSLSSSDCWDCNCLIGAMYDQPQFVLYALVADGLHVIVFRHQRQRDWFWANLGTPSLILSHFHESKQLVIISTSAFLQARLQLTQSPYIRYLSSFVLYKEIYRQDSWYKSYDKTVRGIRRAVLLLGACQDVYKIHLVEISPLFQCPNHRLETFPGQPATILSPSLGCCQDCPARRLRLRIIDVAWAPTLSCARQVRKIPTRIRSS